MLKHPRDYIVCSWCFVSFEKVSKFILDQFESSHHNLNRFTKVSDFMWIDSTSIWIDSCMHHIFYVWIVSHNSLTFIESIHSKFESIQSSSGYTRIDSNTSWIVSSFILLVSVFLLSESIHTFSESIQPIVCCAKI